MAHSHRKQVRAFSPSTKLQESELTQGPRSTTVPFTALSSSHTLRLHFPMLHTAGQSHGWLWEIFKLVLCGSCEWTDLGVEYPAMKLTFQASYNQVLYSPWTALVTTGRLLPKYHTGVSGLFRALRKVQNFKMKTHKVIVSSGQLLKKKQTVLNKTIR